MHLSGERADRALAALLGLSRSRVAVWFDAGFVTLKERKENKKRKKGEGEGEEEREAGYRLKASDRLMGGATVLFPAAGHPGYDTSGTTETPQGEDLPLTIVYEDDDLIVVDKPAGLVVHPAAGHWQGTLVNALLGRSVHLARSLAEGEVEPEGPRAAGSEPPLEVDVRPGIVHRLDKDTSGLLVVAKSPTARTALERLFREHRIERTYVAIVHGDPPADRGRIEAPLARDARNRLKYTVRSNGRAAVTHFEVLERYPKGAVLSLRLETGRTHQIRVHLAHLGIPVAGDPLYGFAVDRAKSSGQLLHSWRLRLRHPVSGRELSLEAPWPERLVLARERLRRGEDPLP